MIPWSASPQPSHCTNQAIPMHCKLTGHQVDDMLIARQQTSSYLKCGNVDWNHLTLDRVQSWVLEDSNVTSGSIKGGEFPD